MKEVQRPNTIVRVAASTDLERVGAAYATAFADEAVAAWAFPNGTLSTALHGDAFAHALDGGEVLIGELPDGTIAGVSVWLTVHTTEQLRREAAALADLATTEPELTRIATVMRLVTSRHPDTPHVYLSAMGVLPHARGRGVGGAILRHRLARADDQRQPVYLEASTPRNQRLYARHGFHPTGRPIALPDAGPRLQPMWRD